MYVSMFSNTVNTEAARKYEIVYKIYFKIEDSVPNTTRERELFRKML